MKNINKLIVNLGMIVGLTSGLVSCASVADVSAKTGVSTVAVKNSTSSAEHNPIYRVRLFFGLSLPTGGGVSLKQWQAFEQDVIAKTFDGFNVVDSTGFYKGEPERSKVVTLIVTQDQMDKVRSVASQYAATFKQDSVMMVKVKVDEWAFIGPNG